MWLLKGWSIHPPLCSNYYTPELTRDLKNELQRIAFKLSETIAMAMNIYQLRYTKSANHIYAVPDHDKFVREVLRTLAKLERNAPIPKFQLADPDLPKSDFFHLSDRVLVFTKSVYLSALGPFLDFSGNVHDSHLTDSGEEIYMLNITAKFNCIDRDNTIYNTERGGEETGVDHGFGIKKPAFYTNLIGDSSIFKIPQSHGTIFVASDPSETDDFTIFITNRA